MPEGFRRPFRGNPQQGTLFDKRELPAEPVDSPGMQKRGRRQEMMAAMPQTKVHGSDPRHAETASKIRDRGRVAERYENSDVAIHNTATDHAGKARRAEIARDYADNTTVPPSDLKGLAQISEGQYSYGQLEDGSPSLHPQFVGGGGGAHYSTRAHANGPVIQASGKMDTGTLTHELGHHVSAKTPGHEERQVPRTTDPRGGTVGPREEAFADDYAVTHADPGYAGYGGSFLANDPVYKSARQTPPARGGSLNLSRQFAPQQEAAFDVEDAWAPEADTDVQAYTRNEGREVLGWGPRSPSPYGTREQVLKHNYEDREDGNFTGANYASMFNDDVLPDRLGDDALGSSRPAQLWRR